MTFAHINVYRNIQETIWMISAALMKDLRLIYAAFKGHSVDSTSCLGRRDVCFRCVCVGDRQRENKKGGWNGVIYMSVHHWVKIISVQRKNNFVCLERREGIGASWGLFSGKQVTISLMANYLSQLFLFLHFKKLTNKVREKGQKCSCLVTPTEVDASFNNVRKGFLMMKGA